MSSLPAWRKLGSLATHYAGSENSDQTGWMPMLIWVFAGRTLTLLVLSWGGSIMFKGERGCSVVACRTPKRKVEGSKPTAAVLCPWARHFTPRKYWLITQEAVAPSRHDWKIVDWDVKPQHKQTNQLCLSQRYYFTRQQQFIHFVHHRHSSILGW